MREQCGCSSAATGPSGRECLLCYACALQWEIYSCCLVFSASSRSRRCDAVVCVRVAGAVSCSSCGTSRGGKLDGRQLEGRNNAHVLMVLAEHYLPQILAAT